ncbi:hypothetical protein GCM10009760_52730 [Kitasatospora kazusensis]|uniref:Uncharacterized protein n=1 Tax=Kitasatospora kazusensis TaxID=407974 RepID=A0ABP5LXR7_9ACTN
MGNRPLVNPGALLDAAALRTRTPSPRPDWAGLGRITGNTELDGRLVLDADDGQPMLSLDPGLALTLLGIARRQRLA